VLADATRDLDVGLVVSNAGTGNPGRFLDKSREELMQLLRLNTVAHLDIARHFGERLARRGYPSSHWNTSGSPGRLAADSNRPLKNPPHPTAATVSQTPTK
jgi:NAD(P)-dependent dehydrogenase (short-subunit alcohol dehydrogenase family)